MITADQLVCHALGDYVLQSDWMASEKVKRWWPAFVHAYVYSLSFLALQPSWTALAVIIGSHAVIDRLRLARFVVFAKNFIAAPAAWPTWADCTATGYPSARPPWLSVWLLIIADNVIHVLVNAAALRWL